jgi:hypothetical protein
MLISGTQDDLNGNQTAGQNVSCECGVSTSDDIVVSSYQILWAAKIDNQKLQCSICNNLQHMHCYGYLTTPSTSEFVCYTCLLEGENILISEMKNMCLKRRALHHLRGRAPVSGKELAGYLSKA